MNFGRCGGKLVLDWMYLSLSMFSSDIHDNWSGGTSLVMEIRVALLVDGISTVIASQMAIFNEAEF